MCPFSKRNHHPEHTSQGAAFDARIEFYWRPGCPYCRALDRGLRRAGVPVTKINTWEDRSAAERVRAAAGGNEVVPTVFVNGDPLVNPTIGDVLRAATA